MTGLTTALHEYLCAFLLSCSIILRMRSVLDKIRKENQNTLSHSVNFPENLADCETMCKNVVRAGQVAHDKKEYSACLWH
jgi:hypothetical protein